MIPREIIDDLDLLATGIQDVADMLMSNLDVSGGGALNALAVKLRKAVDAMSEICLTAKGGKEK